MSDKPKLRDIRKILERHPQNYQDHKKQNNTPKLSQIEEDWENVMTQCNVEPWVGSWIGKRMSVEQNSEIQIKSVV